MTDEPIILNRDFVLEKGRAAYLAGELSAQGPTPQCAYRDDSGRPCIIGAALTDEQIDFLSSRNIEHSIRDLIDRRAVATDDSDFLADLQAAHDSWAGNLVNFRVCGLPKYEIDATQAERTLRELLGITE